MPKNEVEEAIPGNLNTNKKSVKAISSISAPEIVFVTTVRKLFSYRRGLAFTKLASSAVRLSAEKGVADNTGDSLLKHNG